MEKNSAKIEELFLNTLKQNGMLLKNQTICIALSGGADSMVLLNLFYKYQKQLNVFLCAANVEHGIRGETSKKDSEFVKNYCDKLNLPVYTASFDVPALANRLKISTETAARNVRKEFFNKILAENKADKIALAHHANDNAETVLMNIFRGCGLKGASGMDYVFGNFIRPLLDMEKEDILFYAECEHIPFVNDETNSDDRYTRNFIRNRLITLAKNKFPAVVKSINRFSKNIRQNLPEDYSGFEKDENCVYIALSELENNPYFKIKAALAALNVKSDFSAKNSDVVLSLKNCQSGKSVSICHGITATRIFDKIMLSKNSPLSLEEKSILPFSLKEVTKGISLNNFSIRFLKYDINEKKDYKNFRYVDVDKIPNETVWRFRQPGDIFTPCNGKTKSFKKWLNDKKIPLNKRDMPVLATDNIILIAGSYEISNRIKIDGESKNIYKIFIS